MRATLVAAGLCSIPAAIACGILILDADRLFALLLGNAATMPPAATPILVVLIIANLTQMVSNSVLVHNGYFKEVARIGMAVVAAMIGVGAITVLAHLDFVHFLQAYVAVYACGAATAVVLMIRGPITAGAYGGGVAENGAALISGGRGASASRSAPAPC